MSTEPNPEDVKVQREEDGQWWHPSIPWDDVPEDTDATPLLESLGYETAFISMEFDAPDLLDKYEDGADINCWSPSRPEGEGWFLGAIYHTEDGPAACWLRKRRPLNGQKTHPLSKHALGVLRDLARGPVPGYEINPGVRDRLSRGGLANQDFQDGRFWRITDEGRRVVADGEES